MTKHALVTGGSAGLGFEAAKSLVLAGWRVSIAARGSSRLDAAVAALRGLRPDAAVEGLNLDLSSLADIDRFAREIINSGTQLDALLCNAGAKIEAPMKQTRDGFEWHIGVNHLGHFALVAGVLPQLASAARITLVSSIVARKGDPAGIFRSADLSLSPGQAYANSKLANLMFALELNRRLGRAGSTVSATAAHPGFARASAYGSWAIRFGEYLAAQSANRGAQPLVEALSAAPGSYLGPRILEMWGSPRSALIHDAALDGELCDKLIRESERLNGRTLAI